jgi:predicted nucleotidyltransferase
LPVDLERVLRAYRALLVAEYGTRLESLRLFGSRARGDAADESDADVCVVIRGLSEEERPRAIDLAFQAWRSVGRKGPLPSPLVWSDVEFADRVASERRIALDVLREGIPI